MVMNIIGRQRLAWLCVMMACAAGCRAADGLSIDVGQFFKDDALLVAKHAEIEADRATMGLDVARNDAIALNTDVLKFFTDRKEAANRESAKVTERHQIRQDIQLAAIPFDKPTQGTKNLAQDAAAFVKAHDARVAAEAQIDLDLLNLYTSFVKSDVAGMTSNANSFFQDRHNWLQQRKQVVASVVALKKDVKFKPSVKPVVTKGGNLSADTTTYLTDRAKWQQLEVTVLADIANLRAALGTPDSLESIVNTFLTDRHAHFVTHVQLGLDIRNLRVDVGLKVADKPVKPLPAAKKGNVKPSKEDDAGPADADLDDSLIDEGDK